MDTLTLDAYTPVDALPALRGTALDHYAARLSRPMRPRTELVGRIHVTTCECGARVEFITYRATDCSLHGLIGLDGAYSDAYGIYCRAHA